MRRRPERSSPPRAPTSPRAPHRANPAARRTPAPAAGGRPPARWAAGHGLAPSKAEDLPAEGRKYDLTTSHEGRMADRSSWAPGPHRQPCRSGNERNVTGQRCNEHAVAKNERRRDGDAAREHVAPHHIGCVTRNTQERARPAEYEHRIAVHRRRASDGFAGAHAPSYAASGDMNGVD